MADSTLDETPDAATISNLRSQARDEDESITVTFPVASSERKRLVVSPRGTCVVLNDVSEDSFNPSVSAEDIAAELASWGE